MLSATPTIFRLYDELLLARRSATWYTYRTAIALDTRHFRAPICRAASRQCSKDSFTDWHAACLCYDTITCAHCQGIDCFWKLCLHVMRISMPLESSAPGAPDAISGSLSGSGALELGCLSQYCLSIPVRTLTLHRPPRPSGAVCLSTETLGAACCYDLRQRANSGRDTSTT